MDNSELDIALKDYYENSVIFKGTKGTKIIQNELLDYMLAVAQDRIRKEVFNTEYVAVIADETTDVANQYQMTVVFRYILPNGTPTFWCFTNPSDAVNLSECIRTILKAGIDKQEKLI
ncbi:protein of unknown function (DUF4371) [Popillia japonica]|uniref:DUF4371 domain-containing protein n=1 Tax=Popillia japonica TaxID=7064 RepID=A0AAW1JG68_POPJA